jgi:hypothetical protein
MHRAEKAWPVGALVGLVVLLTMASAGAKG